MYTLFVDMVFKAQHQLSFENGVTEPLHEHDWKVCVAVSSEQLNKDALVIDFKELKCMTESILQGFRRQRLESLPILKNSNVSAETLARTLHDQLVPKLPHPVRLDFIEITEAPGCRARYTP
ncbi:MAG: 6-carboxytetrahydropterin synthase QueD [Planctomycetota bacterium]|nr:MAG: 6-carboxytetrahydropterin synthase QueD [Planctomycetota bacterium]